MWGIINSELWLLVPREYCDLDGAVVVKWINAGHAQVSEHPHYRCTLQYYLQVLHALFANVAPISWQKTPHLLIIRALCKSCTHGVKQTWFAITSLYFICSITSNK